MEVHIMMKDIKVGQEIWFAHTYTSTSVNSLTLV